MAKVGVVLLADTESHGDMGRMVNALTSAREFKDGGDEVTIILDGAGTKWVAELSSPEHRYNREFAEVKDRVAGACAYCSRAFGVTEAVEAAGVPLLRDYADHPSLKRLIDDGYQILTF